MKKTFRLQQNMAVHSLKYAANVPKHGYFPIGIKVASTSSGVKKDGALDLGLVLNVWPDKDRCSVAGVFTSNRFRAAPVVESMRLINQKMKDKSGINAIVINSGCANAMTGEVGIQNCRDVLALLNDQIGLKDSAVAMSTGVIGQKLQMGKILSGIKGLFSDTNETFGDDYASWLNLSKAITTTDTFPKLVSGRFKLSSGHEYTITGIAKGAGMICPNMATMLAVICTDLPIEPTNLQKLLKYTVDRSFNCISVDGDMSTNDTVYLMSNGALGVEQITEGQQDFNSFQNNLLSISQKLAQLVVKDGEGSTKFVTVDVKNSLNFVDAKLIAKSISNSLLVKCALYGEDANWGRILCAIGYTDLKNIQSLNENLLTVSFISNSNNVQEKLTLIENGKPELNINEEKASKMLALPDISIEVDLKTGQESCKYWTCDISHDYVTINGDYRS